MEILKENLTPLFYLGVWKPNEWTPGNYRSVLYSVYTTIVSILFCIFFMTEFLDLIFITTNVDEFISNFFLLTAIFAACFKTALFIWRRESLNYVIDNLKKYLLDERNSKEENEIWNSYSSRIRFLTIYYLSVNFVGVALFTYGRTSGNIKNRELPYRAWVPYDYSRPVIYWVSAVGQLVTECMLAGVNITFILFFAAIMMSFCAQINILKAKFKRHFSSVDLPDSDHEKINASQIIGDLVDSYHLIKRLYETANQIFSWVIFFQYWIGSMIFCTSAYQMSRMKVFSVDFSSFAFYITAIMTELFIACFFCNEVSIEFAKLHGAFYDCQWYLLNDYNKKSIGLMMTNSMKPVYFTCGYVIHLSLDSFTSILKLSYSIYNLLQNTI